MVDEEPQGAPPAAEQAPAPEELEPAPEQPEVAPPPDKAEANVLFARKMIATGSAQTAIRLLTEAVELKPTADSLLMLAELELDRPPLHAKALEHLKQATELDPRNTTAWLLLANYWSLRGQPEKQRRCLERILVYEPNNNDIRDAIAMLTTKP